MLFHFVGGKDPAGLTGNGEIGGSGDSAGLGAVRSGMIARPEGGAPPGFATSPAGGAGNDDPGADEPGRAGVAGGVGGAGTAGRPLLGTALVDAGG
jgi:hypothetical protein